VGELADFQVDQHMAAQQAVVDNQIDEKMVAVKGEALLPGFKQKALAQRQQKMLDLADDGALQAGLGIPGLFGQAQKLQHQRLLEQVLGPADDLPLLGKLANAVFAAAQGQARSYRPLSNWRLSSRTVQSWVAASIS